MQRNLKVQAAIHCYHNDQNAWNGEKEKQKFNVQRNLMVPAVLHLVSTFETVRRKSKNSQKDLMVHSQHV